MLLEKKWAKDSLESYVAMKNRTLHSLQNASQSQNKSRGCVILVSPIPPYHPTFFIDVLGRIA